MLVVTGASTHQSVSGFASMLRFTIMSRPVTIQSPIKGIPGDLHPLHGADNTSPSSVKV